MRSITSQLTRPEKIHGVIFDGAVFLGNFLFIGLIPTLGDNTSELRAGVFLIAAVLTQIAGAWLKKKPLSQRIGEQPWKNQSGVARGFMDFLLFLHFILFSVITLFGVTLLGNAFGQPGVAILDNNLWVIFALIIGALATYSVWRAGRGSPAVKAKPGLPWIEYAADGILWVSVLVVTQVFWGGLLELIETSRGAGLSLTSVILLVAMSVLFVFFYLPGRYLFLVEDSGSPLTWLQAWIAMLPVAWVVLIG